MTKNETIEAASLMGVKMASMISGQSAEYQAMAIEAMVQFLDVEINETRIVPLVPMPTEEEKKRWRI